MPRPAASRTAALLARLHGERAPFMEGGFGVAIDTREAKPLELDLSIPVVVRKLDVGDYAPIGFESRCAVERKSLSDWIGSMTWERARFERELAQLATFEFAAVVIESSYAEVARRNYRQQVDPSAVLGTAASYSVRYCPVFWAGGRNGAADLTARLLRAFFDRATSTRAA